jgi:hypothetical protein
VIALLGILEGQPIVLALLLVRIEVLFGQTRYRLHLALLQLALTVVQLTLYALVLLHLIVSVFIFLFELMQVYFWIVLS